jgi:hypothetical protein
LKRLQLEANHILPSIAEVKNPRDLMLTVTAMLFNLGYVDPRGYY